jgi:TonB family protein
MHARQSFPSLLAFATVALAAHAGQSAQNHVSVHAQRSAQDPRFANIRTLSFDAETVHVRQGATAPSSPPPSSPAPSQAPGGRELNAAAVQGIVRGHLGEMAACAATGAVNGRVHGSVTLRLVIDPHGHIRDAQAPQSTMLWSVPRCIVDAARRWQFPRPPNGLTVVVVYPFNFTSE